MNLSTPETRVADPNIQSMKAIQIPNPRGASTLCWRKSHASIGIDMIGRMNALTPNTHQSGNPRNTA